MLQLVPPHPLPEPTLSVRFACAQIYLSLLIEQIVRGPKFTRLPPAHLYNTAEHRARLHVSHVQSGKHRGQYAATRWSAQDPIVHSIGYNPDNNWRALLPEKPYEFNPYDGDGARKHLTASILNEIEEIGDVCGMRTKKGHTKDCLCILIKRPDDHRHKHRCRHGLEWW